MRIFKRKIYNQLLNWKSKSNGKTAVLVEGARRVGKSTIVRQFAEKEYKSYILIDFSIAGKDIIELFGRTRQTLWGECTDANLKTVAKRYMIEKK